MQLRVAVQTRDTRGNGKLSNRALVRRLGGRAEQVFHRVAVLLLPPAMVVMLVLPQWCGCSTFQCRLHRRVCTLVRLRLVGALSHLSK